LLLLLSALPTFEQFPVTETFSGKPAAPILKTIEQRSFRSVIREDAAKGPNFAAHYTIATWGCGSSCISGAVVDAKTGVVTDLPFPNLSFDSSEPLQFKLNSRLLIVRGCPGESNCAEYYYEWTGRRFKLIRRVP
jgi:hypothetical protein